MDRQIDRQGAAQRCLWCRAPLSADDTICGKCDAAVPPRNVRSVEIACQHCGQIYLLGFVACPVCREPAPDYDGSGGIRLCRLCGEMAARTEACPSCGDPPDAAVWPPPIFQDIRRPRPRSRKPLTGMVGGDIVAGFLFVTVCTLGANNAMIQFAGTHSHHWVGALEIVELIGWPCLAKPVKRTYPDFAGGMVAAWGLCLLAILPTLHLLP